LEKVVRLNKKTDYCLRVLIYLQKRGGKSKIQDIADCYGVSKNHLSVAVNRLSELGYILSNQGPKGGIEFNPQLAGVSVARLVTEIEAFEVAECFEVEGESCSLNSHCKFKKILVGATNSFIEELDRYQIKDLV
jgi:Rrf2 family transcriptional regulator, nitric oxide-sensitive transcriptional repressor